MSPAGRGRSFLVALLVFVAFGAVLLFSASRTKSGQALIAWFTDQIELEEVRGQVVDATTGSGVPGATVVVHSLVAPMTLSLVGRSSNEAATTGDDGRFVIRYQRLGRTWMSTRADGYATVMRVLLAGEDVVLPTAPSPVDGAIRRGTFAIDLTDSTAQTGFRFADSSVAVAPDSADLWFALDSARVVVRASGAAGLFRDEPPPAPNAIDPLAARCMAPDSGYVQGEVLPAEVSTTTWFVRLRDGTHKARLRVRSYWKGPTAADGYRLDGEYWLNVDGGRNVCETPPEGERYEFAFVERERR